MQLTAQHVAAHIGRLARLGTPARFFPRAIREGARRRSPTVIAPRSCVSSSRTGPGSPSNPRTRPSAGRRSRQLIPKLRASVGAPLGLQTVLLHHFHSQEGLLKEPRLVSESDLAVLRVNAITDPLTGLYNRRFRDRPHLARDRARRALRGHRLDRDDGPARVQVHQRPAGTPGRRQRAGSHGAGDPRVAAGDRRRRPLGRRRIRAGSSEHRHGLGLRGRRTGAQPHRHSRARRPGAGRASTSTTGSRRIRTTARARTFSSRSRTCGCTSAARNRATRPPSTACTRGFPRRT